MKKYIFALVCLITLTVIAVLWTKQPGTDGSTVSPKDLSYKEIPLTIASTTFTAYVSDTAELRSRGLSRFSPLKSTEAMLFMFENEGMWDFWMKDMIFSLDMIWVDASKTIVGIEKNVSPNSFPKSFSAGTKSMYVIEVNAGTSDMFGIDVGDRVIF